MERNYFFQRMSMRFKLDYLVTLIFCFLLQIAFAQNYQMVFEDEFNGTEVDLTNWTFQIGDGTSEGIPGWGNNELQYYREENTTVAGGFMTITAKEESFGGYNYTSSRLITKNKQDFTYGKLEMRAKMPIGQGLWPAFWMLFTDPSIYGSWAAGGEIDIMEYIGSEPEEVFGTIHFGQPFPGNVFSSEEYQLTDGTNFNDDFHTFAIEWEPGEIRWYVDDILYATQNDWFSNGGPYPAPFDQPFHLLLNLAVGGNLPGNPDATTVFPQEFVIDYVRVYEDMDLPAVALTSPTDGSTFTAGDNITIAASPTATQGVAKVEFFQGDLKLGEATSAPYEITVPGVAEGSYRIRAMVTDQNGKINYSAFSEIAVGTATQGPYAMVPASIPGMVEAENFDVGGQGEAYNDSDATLNEGSKVAANRYRNDEGPDIEPTTDTGGGSNIGFTANGEWLEFTVNVQQPGSYDLTARVAGNAGSFSLWFDGADKTGAIGTPATGGFQTWTDVVKENVFLDAGVQVMRLNFLASDFNINKLTFAPADPASGEKVVFDDMEHGDPANNGWFIFSGIGGGGIDPNSSDLPPLNGGTFSLQTGWGSGGTPGFFGGFGRTSTVDISQTTYFNMWINPDAGQDYILEINLQDDDDANGVADDEFQYNLVVSPTGPGAISGGGWQLVSIPLTDFFDDNSQLTGGNGTLDGTVLTVVLAVISNSGADATFRTDYWSFTNGPLGPEINVDPLSYDYGDTAVGSSSARNFVVTNEGCTDLNITSVSLSGADAGNFLIQNGGDPATIGPNGSQNILVRFNPSSLGPKTATLLIESDDADEPSTEIALTGNGIEGSGVNKVVFDDMEHGDPDDDNGYFSFDGESSPTINPTSTDLPPENGGGFAIDVSLGGGSTGGFLGGFGRELPTDLTDMTHFNFWINPDAGQDYTIEIQLQDDDNGDDEVPFGSADDDEFQYNFVVNASGDAIAGGGWQLISLPLADFFDDGTFFGGNGVLDPISTANGGNGQLINVIFGFLTNSGAPISFRTDLWCFSQGPLGVTEPEITASPNPLNFGFVGAGSSTTATLDVSNSGVGELNVTSAAITGANADEFTIISGDAPFTLGVAEIRQIELSFSPTAEGMRQATLTLQSNAANEPALEIPLLGEGSSQSKVVFDDMEHGDPFNNGWFIFNGDGGGGLEANNTDLPPENGGVFSLQTGWGIAGPGFAGGFGRGNTVDITGMTNFDMWINPDAGQDYVLEINIQDDDNGDGTEDDEFQYNLPINATSEISAGGGWQLVSIPLTDFFDDNSFLTGGNGIIDNTVVNVVIAVVSTAGGDANFRTDFWCFSQETSGGNEPMVAAPDPTQDPADVISLFSNVYTDVPVDTFRTPWSDATLEEIQIEGNDTKKYSELNFVGIETIANQIDITGMTHFRTDIWTADATQFRIKLVDFGADGAFDGGDDVEHEVTIENPTQGEWVSLDIPLTDFTGLTTQMNIAQLIYAGQPAGDTTVFIDNIYFYNADGGGAMEPMVAAPDPTQDPADVISLFSNVYTDVPVDTFRTPWSDATLEEIQIEGNDTKKYSELNFVGIETIANQIDITGMTHFRTDIWTADATQFRIKLVDFGADGAFDGGDDVEHEIAIENPTQGEWVSLDIPLTDFTGLTTQMNIAQLIYAGQPAGDTTVFIDNIYFYTEDGGSCEVTIDTQPEDAEVCEGEAVSFSVSASGTGTLSYLWEFRPNPSTPWATGPIFTDSPIANVSSSIGISADGNEYRVTVTSDNGTPEDESDDCSVTSDVATLTVYPLPEPMIMGPSSYPAGGSGVTLDAGPGYVSYLWSPGGETTQMISNALAGTYSVTVIDTNGCEGTSEDFVVTEDGPIMFSVTDFTLVDAVTDLDITIPLVDGAVIDINDLPAHLNLDIRANTTADVESVQFMFDGPGGALDITRPESLLPYALYQDLPINDYRGSVGFLGEQFVLGEYTLTGTPYSLDGLGGTSGTPLTITFEIVDGEPNDFEIMQFLPEDPITCGGFEGRIRFVITSESTSSYSVDLIKEMLLVNSQPANEGEIVDFQGLDAGTYTVIVIQDDTGDTEEVTVTLSDPDPPVVTLAPFANVLDTDPAFALTGGSPAGGDYSGPGVTAGVFDPMAVGPGTYDITYTYTDPSTLCEGSATQSITVINTNVLSVTDFTLVDAVTDLDIVIPLVNGAVIDINDLPAHLNLDIRTNTTPDVESVALMLDGPGGALDVSRSESLLPYALYQDLPIGDYRGSVGFLGEQFVVGEYTLTATPYSLDGLGGTVGSPLTIMFEIVDGDPACADFFAVVDLEANPITCGGNQGIIEIVVGGAQFPVTYEWSHDDSLDISIANDLIAGTYMVTVTDANGCTETLTITLEDPDPPVVTLAPFASVLDTDPAFALTGGSPAGGDYSGPGVTAGVFDPGAVGAGTYDITYTYTDPGTNCEGSATQPITVIDTNVLSVTSLTLVDAVTDMDITIPLVDGAMIDIADLPAHLNLDIRANTTADVESVQFVFDGPGGTLDITRSETLLPYALYQDLPIGDYRGSDGFLGEQFVLGTYTLTVTPYSLDFLGGTMGAPLAITFEIIDGTIELQSEPVVMSIYPNPANATTTASFDKPVEVQKIMVFDMHGRLVKTYPAKNGNGTEYQLDVHDLPAGAYFVRTQDGQGFGYQKQMIIRR